MALLAEWANTYIWLLTVDCCADIMKQALQILDCLTTFYVGAIGTPLWPSVDNKHLTLFLLKAYLSDYFCEIDELSKFFSLPVKEILLIGAKHLIKSDQDKEAIKTLDSLRLSDIETSFWKIMLAAANTKSKLKSLQTISASAATALALTKATENFDHQQTLDIKKNLRISNLEKTVNRQEHKATTIINHLKKSQQKNYHGSQFLESVTSPEKKTLSKQNQNHTRKLKRNIVDLTAKENEEELSTENMTSNITPSPKRMRQQHRKARGSMKTQPPP